MATTFSSYGQNSNTTFLNTTHSRRPVDNDGWNTSLLTGSSTRVELYTTVLCTVFLFSISILGILTNVTLLLASRMRQSLRNLQYGLHYGLAMVNIAFCGCWLPLHVAQVIANFQGHGVHEVVCFLNVVLFNFCMTAVIFIIFFIALQRLYQLSALPIQNLHQVVIRGLMASFSIGCIAAVALAIEFPWNIDYGLCTAGAVDNAGVGDLWFSVAAILFTVIYTLLLLITMVILWIATLAVRHRIRQMIYQPDAGARGDHQLPRGSSGPIEMSETDASHAKSLGSVTFDYTSGATTSSHKESIAESNQSQSRSHSRQLMFIEPKKTDSEEEDDDTFDMKMRMKHQKSASGRRHTVANIGLGDSFLGLGKRRGSLEDSRPKPNYNYIRKWSVDITALQDQLENPKIFEPPEFTKDKNNFRSGIRADKETRNEEGIAEDSIAEHEEEEDEDDANEEANLDSEKPTTNCPGLENDKTEPDSEDVHEEAEESDPLAESAGETPAIVLNGNSHRNQTGNRVDFIDTDILGCDAATLEKFHTEVIQTNKCIFLQLVTLLCILPYTTLQLIQPVMSPRLNRNLTLIAMAQCLIMCFIHPLILIWMDRRMQQAIDKLRSKLTNWRCVCYCNIGKGKDCFSIPHEIDNDPSTTIVA